jgi:hypothetical protein
MKCVKHKLHTVIKQIPVLQLNFKSVEYIEQYELLERDTKIGMA